MAQAPDYLSPLLRMYGDAGPQQYKRVTRELDRLCWAIWKAGERLELTEPELATVALANLLLRDVVDK